MPKSKQSESNPFAFSDSNKRYYTYDYWLKQTFGGKCAKIPLDAGFTCPNIDGRCGVGGCIYCSGRGSGDFAQLPTMPLDEQYRTTKSRLSRKWSVERCIPYFQAHSNTYAPLDVLKSSFEAALGFEGVVGLNIATRADCLPEDTVNYLAELAERTTLTVELGLQSSNDTTAELINRGHSFADFVDGYRRLKAASDRINVCVHIIFGLPDEREEDMLRTVRDVAELHPEQVKIHLLHVLRGTKMAEMYERGEYTPMGREQYIHLVVRALELLPPDTVVARLTGDGMADDLLSPDWSRKKVSVINDIDKLMYSENTWQGRLAAEN
ncbi:MAG: TIGR01212 family radical SAM protein [Clostridia bacterium]|nr:TIGR01212 family radical SAM protein [Clostridia bacterium]